MKENKQSEIKKLTKEEAKNIKGYKITIIDLDTAETVVDEVTPGIIGAFVKSDGSQCISATKCNIIKILPLLSGLERIKEETKKAIVSGVVSSFLGGEENE